MKISLPLQAAQEATRKEALRRNCGPVTKHWWPLKPEYIKTGETEEGEVWEPSGNMLIQDVSEEDWNTLIGEFDAWEAGTEYAKDTAIRYDGKLYQVNQSHTSQADWTPDTTEALYSEIAPEEVVALWKQPTGAHDAYAKGDKVQWPEGTVWESTIEANTTEPGTLSEWGYWVAAEN